MLASNNAKPPLTDLRTTDIGTDWVTMVERTRVQYLLDELGPAQRIRP